MFHVEHAVPRQPLTFEGLRASVDAARSSNKAHFLSASNEVTDPYPAARGPFPAATEGHGEARQSDSDCKSLQLIKLDDDDDETRAPDATKPLWRPVLLGVVLSAVVVAELYSGVKGDAEKAVLDSFVALFPVAPVTAEIARAGGLYRRDYGKTHGVGLADAILAATAEVGGAELATLNVKHYPRVKGLRPAYRKAARRSGST